MKRLLVLLVSFLLLASTNALAAQEAPTGSNTKSLTISKNGSRPSAKAPDDHFSGNVRFDPLFPGNEAIKAAGAYVTFEPGARTAWHSHPIGQYLIVTFGSGLIQEAGGPIQEINPGDVIYIPAGVKHWHGAAGSTAMTHIAITATQDGKTADWMEKVSEEQYSKKK